MMDRCRDGCRAKAESSQQEAAPCAARGVRRLHRRVIGRSITLQPGDIVATGTAVGVGIGFKPPRYLKPGDSIRIEVSSLGTLENPVL
jgi:hypothetical protein